MKAKNQPAEKYDFSAYLPFWDKLSGTQKRALMNCPVCAHPDGEKILLSPCDCSGYLLVLRGGLRVYISSEGGREFTLYRVRQGGLCSLFPIDGAAIPNIVSDGGCAVIHITIEFIMQTLSCLPQTLDFFIGCMGSNLQSVLENIEHVFFGTLKSSIARVIIESCPPDSDTVKITHEQLANHIGTTREVVSREIEGFRDMGLIYAGRGRITILDHAGLKLLTCP